MRKEEDEYARNSLTSLGIANHSNNNYNNNRNSNSGDGDGDGDTGDGDTGDGDGDTRIDTFMDIDDIDDADAWLIKL